MLKAGGKGGMELTGRCGTADALETRQAPVAQEFGVAVGVDRTKMGMQGFDCGTEAEAPTIWGGMENIFFIEISKCGPAEIVTGIGSG